MLLTIRGGWAGPLRKFRQKIHALEELNFQLPLRSCLLYAIVVCSLKQQQLTPRFCLELFGLAFQFCYALYLSAGNANLGVLSIETITNFALLSENSRSWRVVATGHPDMLDLFK